MKIDITGHHTETGTALKEYVDMHLQKINKYFDTEVEPKIIFEKIPHNMFKAEILIKDKKGMHAEFVAEGENSNIHRAFDIALDKLQHQLRKYHDKVKNSFKQKMRNHEKEIDLVLSPNTDS